ncbi:MAG: tetratricopeptide repeat protein [Parcubacteria group bacterium]
MNPTYKLSLIVTLLLVLLLPIFFLPVSILSLSVAKTALLALGVVVALVGIVIQVIGQGGFSLPRSYLMWFVPLLPLAYLVSALLSPNISKSLFGYNLEVGTFGFVLLASLLLGVIVVIFSDTAKVLRVWGAFLISMSLLAVFALVKVLSGGFPVWGAFSGNMANPIGGWPDYAMAFGLLAVILALALSVFNLEKVHRIILSILFFASLFLMVVISFSTAFLLTLVVGVLGLVYVLKIDSQTISGFEGESKPTRWPMVLLVVVTLVFVINPTISATYGSLSDTISAAFSVSNVEVRPSFSATMDITKAVLSESPVFGGGPNTFSENWLLHKPQEINETIFWNTAFPFGLSFVLTQVASLGLLGTLVWLTFFVLLLGLMFKVLARLPDDRFERGMLLASLFAVLFLWTGAFLYTPSVVMLSLAFVFSGLFLASARTSGVIGTKDFIFSKNNALNFVSVIAAAALGIGLVTFGFSVFQRTMAAHHFQRALLLSGTPDTSLDEIESRLVSAMRLSQQDIYYSAFSEISLARAGAVLNSSEGTSEANLELFQTALSNGIASAQTAVTLNPQSYRNRVILGSIYSSLVPAPFSVEGAYESALETFGEARLRNPMSPEVPLLLARLELGRGELNTARERVAEAIALKADYADAYFLSTQIEINANNISQAIRSAETSAVLSPDNAGVFFQLGLLKYTVENWSGATSAFEQALRIMPEYANAKYFLGLSLDRLGRREEALRHFEALIETNPDNTEVVTIVENLRAGRDPLFGLPKAGTIEDRAELPITDNAQ